MSSWYRVGTISLIKDSKSVTGEGTFWSDIGILTGADTLIVGNNLFEVSSYQSNTQLTLAEPFPGESAAGVAYAIIATGLMPSEIALQIKEALRNVTITEEAIEKAVKAAEKAQQAADTVAGVVEHVDQVAHTITESVVVAQQSASIAEASSTSATQAAQLASDASLVAQEAANNLPNATTAGPNKVVVSNDTATGWDYKNGSELSQILGFPSATAAGLNKIPVSNGNIWEYIGFMSGALTNNGYVKIPTRLANGDIVELIIQWGSITPVAANTLVTAAFPTPFTKAIFATYATNYTNSTISVPGGIGSYSVSLTTIGIANSTAGIQAVRWLAIGL